MGVLRAVLGVLGVVAALSIGWALPARAAEGPRPAAPARPFEYAAASLALPAGAQATAVLGAWHSVVLERGLAPDLVDHREGLVLGDWLARPHVCSGAVRYHLVLLPGASLSALVVAECSAAGTNLDKAAVGLAEELGKRLGVNAAPAAADVKDVPARLWQARLWRGNAEPPAPAAAP